MIEKMKTKNSLLSLLAKPTNRQMVGWLGGGIMAVAAGGWTVVTYVWPAPGGKGSINCAQNASIATQGDVSGVTINASGSTLQASGPLDCGNSAPAKH